MTTPKFIEGHPSRGAAWEHGFSEPNLLRRDFGTLLIAAQHEKRAKRHVFAILRQWATVVSNAGPRPVDLSSIVGENDLAMTNLAMKQSNRDDIEQ